MSASELQRICAKCHTTAATANDNNVNLRFHRFPLPGKHGCLKARVWAEYCFPAGNWSTEKSLKKLHQQHKMLCSKHFDDASYTSSSRTRLNNFAIPVGTDSIMLKLRHELSSTSSDRSTNQSIPDVTLHLTRMSSSLPPLEKFDCDSDPHSIGLRWEKWKKELCIYLEAANINNPVKKRATLLLMGGLNLQEVYYNIPGAHVSSTDDPDIDIFSIALQKLDEYFAPKQSKVYERYVLRLMKQEPEEKFEKFLVRLRIQADKCGFTNKEEHLVDQITEKCSSSELRKKILKGGDNMSLEDILFEANTLENVNQQMKEFNQKPASSSVNKIDMYKANLIQDVLGAAVSNM